MLKRLRLISIISAAALAATAFAVVAHSQTPLPTLASLAALPSLHSQDEQLEAAYDAAWSSLNMDYANRDKLTGDWPQWEHKFDGKLHNEQDLTNALNALLQRVGDPEVRVISSAELAAKDAREAGGHLGYGLEAKFLPVFGPTARIEVEQQVYGACANGNCWQGEGQAYKDGLRSGDIIVAVDGKSFKGLEFWDLFKYIIAHDQVTFTVLRGSQMLTIVAHPQRSHGSMNLNLDASIEPDGQYQQAFVFAAGSGPAEVAGIAERDELESVNGKPAAQMTDAELKALSGSCHVGDTLRVKVRRLPNEVVIPCGVVPYSDHNTAGSGSMGGQRPLWQYSVLNLDAPDVLTNMANFLSGFHDAKNVVALLDLRGSYGTKIEAEQAIATLFVQQGPLGCLYGGWRTDILCSTAVKGRVFDRSDAEFRTGPQLPFNGKVAVIIDDQTSGTALMLAAEMQHAGAVIITGGSQVRHWPDLYSTVSLQGDPAGRSLVYPVWHTSLTDNKDTDIRADIVAAQGKEFEAAQHYLGLDLTPYDMRKDN